MNDCAEGAGATDRRREDLWEALSDLFIDNEVDYAAIARQVAGEPLPELERILFEEVAPYCGPNLLTPVPPVWSGFSRESLVAGIRARLQRIRVSRFAALRHRCLVRYLRWQFAAEWRQLRDALAANGGRP